MPWVPGAGIPISVAVALEFARTWLGRPAVYCPASPVGPDPQLVEVLQGVLERCGPANLCPRCPSPGPGWTVGLLVGLLLGVALGEACRRVWALRLVPRVRPEAVAVDAPGEPADGIVARRIAEAVRRRRG